MSSECQHKETIFNFLSTHTHPNEITTCEICKLQKECRVGCSMPKSKKLIKICQECDNKRKKKYENSFQNGEVFGEVLD